MSDPIVEAMKPASAPHAQGPRPPLASEVARECLLIASSTSPAEWTPEGMRTAIVEALREYGLSLPSTGLPDPAPHAEVREKTIEECARIAETAGCGDPKCTGCYGNQIAAAIRDL